MVGPRSEHLFVCILGGLGAEAWLLRVLRALDPNHLYLLCLLPLLAAIVAKMGLYRWLTVSVKIVKTGKKFQYLKSPIKIDCPGRWATIPMWLLYPASQALLYQVSHGRGWKRYLWVG